LRRQGAKRAVLMGASLGALAAVGGGPDVTPPPAGVVFMSAPTAFAAVDGEASARRLTVPVLYLAARDDGRFGAAARALFRVTPATDKSLRILPGANHGMDLLSYDQGPTVRALVFAFLAEHLPD